MDKQVYKILEYHKIIELLQGNIYTFSGKQILKKISPAMDISIIQELQKETTEMKSILELEGDPPFIPLKDIEKDIKQSKIHGSILDSKALFDIGRVLEAIYVIKEFFNKIIAREYPVITKKIEYLKVFRSLEKAIKRCINEEYEIVDDASPSLKKIRQQIIGTEKKIRDKLESILRNPQNRTLIQDEIITIRQGRFVLPIKQQEKGKFSGIIHDRSESGVTVFIEPLPIVELNNELRELYQEEKKEKYRILQKITSLVGLSSSDILSSYQVLGELDLILAKAKLSIQMKANEPNINTEGIIHLKKARHPLLKNNVIPIDINLGDNFDILVVTGPNTGGKTVTLKTVGLLNLMAQSGLHIPAGIDSEIPIFKKIFADIGDEQSIEQNLSTFSSHMKNIIKILESSDKNTLVLLDELGAGTDPSEGSALSMAILDSLRYRRAKVMSTTHHDSIKAYAYMTDRVMNARMEFDEETLFPTYKITIGLPGKSCAFSIAQKLGLKENIIKDAQNYLEKEKLDLENLIRKMEKDRKSMADNLKFTQKEKEEVNELKKELDEKIIEMEKEKEKIVLNAYHEAEEIIALTQKRAKEIIRSLNKNRVGKERIVEESSDLKSLNEEIKNKLIKYDQSDKENDDIFEGDFVKIKSINREGIVVEKKHKKNQYLIQVNNLKLTRPLNDIVKINKKMADNSQIEKTAYNSDYSLQKNRLDKKARFRHEINIRQMTVYEAKIKLEKYLDDAFLLNVSPIYIIHGKGKGILRGYVAQLLDKLSYVSSYRSGESHEGGDGVTVVYF